MVNGVLNYAIYVTDVKLNPEERDFFTYTPSTKTFSLPRLTTKSLGGEFRVYRLVYS